MKTANEIATEAARLVGGDRAQQHGDKGANFEATAKLWNAYLSIRKGGVSAPITGSDFANMMVLAKMSRVHTGVKFNMDNFVDMAGYAACGGEVALQEQSADTPPDFLWPFGSSEGFQKWNGGLPPEGKMFDFVSIFGHPFKYYPSDLIEWENVAWWRPSK